MAVVRELPSRPSVPTAIRRALTLRCPRCGRGEVFVGWFTMRETCEACGLKYEREPGYFVGAIYLNFAVTAVVCLGGAMLVAMALGLPPWGEVGVASVLCVLVPLLFFRYSKSLWLGIDYFVTMMDEAWERRGRRTE
jgi:uncharacterized protein (DUF983 family)